MEFKLVSDYLPRGDQPKAIDAIVRGIKEGKRFQTLLGVTGSGKTFTLANVIAKVQKPTLVISHNKTLAAQLCSEFRAFFPDNAVEYFVSYYDYYQPEAYVPQTDTYIEKETSINEEIDRLRHAATQSVLSRRDTIVVASVSCIYGLGSPKDYKQLALTLHKGEKIKLDLLLKKLVEMQYERNDTALYRGKFRVKGDTLELCSIDEKRVLRLGFFGDEIERIEYLEPTTGKIMGDINEIMLFPATHFVTLPEKMDKALKEIERELEERLSELKSEGKLLEAQRLEQRTKFDIEMIKEIGYCSGIENYSRFFDGRKPGETPNTLIDYFPDDFLLIIDESHVTIPQLRGMYGGDRSRKENLVKYGFRLPSAYDNRPLFFEEFEKKIKQVIFMSATPGQYELSHSEQVVEQIIRPTGLVDPEVVVKPTKGQVDDLLNEIKKRVEKSERVLVTTLTKKMAENLSEYLSEVGVKVHYLHSDIETIDRIEILRNLRLGEYDVVVGINLLREGLDLPEVSLVAILDADKEGFLRSEVSLIQTIGRAARNVSGQVIMYADKITESMKRAIEETARRRRMQIEYNLKHKIKPESIRKEIRDIAEAIAKGETEMVRFGDTNMVDKNLQVESEVLIAQLEEEMYLAAKNLEFERAAFIRDKIKMLRAGKGVMEASKISNGSLLNSQKERKKGLKIWRKQNRQNADRN